MITRQLALDFMRRCSGRVPRFSYEYDVYKYTIEALKQQKIGYWKRNINDNVCSACGEHSNTLWRSRYCPSCGAKMESEGNI